VCRPDRQHTIDKSIGGIVLRATLRFLALLIVAFPASAVAQDQLASLLPKAFAEVVTMQPDSKGSAADHETHFFAALGEQGQAAFAMNKLIVLQLDTFPLPTTSVAFVFSFDPETGLYKAATKSFGPGFTERALTTGRGHVELGVNYQHVTFKSFEGIDLHSNNLVYAMQHNDCCGKQPSVKSPNFEADVITMAPVIHITGDTVAPYISYGLSNRWDVAAVVPVVRVALDTTVTATIDRLGETCPDTSTTAPATIVHTWDGTCNPTKTVSMKGDATGIGDIDLRTKYRLMDTKQGGIAAGLDVRLPTGDKEQLLGTGATRVKLQLIMSGEFSRVSPHANLGYTISSGQLSSATTALPATTGPTNPATTNEIATLRTQPLGGSLDVPNEFDYNAGFDAFAHPQFTIWADLIGRTVFDVERFNSVPTPFSGVLGSITINNFQSTGTGNLNLVLGAVGAKFNVPGTHLLLTGSVLFPLTNAGLRPSVTPVIGLDYSFAK
jgi:hypothetical protein